MRRTTLLLAITLLVAGACGGDQEVVTGDGGDRSDRARTNPDLRPGGAPGGLVVSVELDGGFLAPGQDFRSVPQAVVYEDGTTLSPGATLMIFPGPALPAVSAGHLEESVIGELVVAARQAGLLDDAGKDFGEPPIADAPTTTITVVAGGIAHETSIYALDSMGGPLGGITPQQQEARDRVGAFVDLVARQIVDAEDGFYLADRYRVLPLGADQGPDPDLDAGIEPDTRDWPFPGVALRHGECVAVGRDDAATFRTAFEPASEITRWRSAAGETFVLSARPVFPHESDCPQP